MREVTEKSAGTKAKKAVEKNPQSQAWKKWAKEHSINALRYWIQYKYDLLKVQL